MSRAFLRLVALVAVLLMPAGMAAAPAAALPAEAAQPGHCADHQKPADEPFAQQVHCTACSALPALDDPVREGRKLSTAAGIIARSQPISGIILEIATPPPKRA